VGVGSVAAAQPGFDNEQRSPCGHTADPRGSDDVRASGLAHPLAGCCSPPSSPYPAVAGRVEGWEAQGPARILEGSCAGRRLWHPRPVRGPKESGSNGRLSPRSRFIITSAHSGVAARGVEGGTNRPLQSRSRRLRSRRLLCGANWQMEMVALCGVCPPLFQDSGVVDRLRSFDVAAVEERQLVKEQKGGVGSYLYTARRGTSFLVVAHRAAPCASGPDGKRCSVTFRQTLRRPPGV